MGIIRRVRTMLRTAILWEAAWPVPGLVWMSVLAFLRRDASPHVGLSGLAQMRPR